MSTEQTTKWVIRAAKAAQFCKNSELRLFFLNSDIAAMRSSAGTLRRSSGRCKVFGGISHEILAPQQSLLTMKALAFMAFGFVQYALL